MFLELLTKYQVRVLAERFPANWTYGLKRENNRILKTTDLRTNNIHCWTVTPACVRVTGKHSKNDCETRYYTAIIILYAMADERKYKYIYINVHIVHWNSLSDPLPARIYGEERGKKNRYVLRTEKITRRRDIGLQFCARESDGHACFKTRWLH